jgi:hypothetical protein
MRNELDPTGFRKAHEWEKKEFPSGRDFWDEQTNNLGYAYMERYGWEERSIVAPVGWDVHDNHQYACDDLSRRIAVESGQAIEHAPGIIEYKNPHVYYVVQEKHEARIGDRWNSEICH